MPRPYVRRELRLLGEFLASNYPNATIANNVRLGAVPLHLARLLPVGVNKNTLNGYRRYADAVIKLPDKVILVEAKIVLDTDAVGALMLYAKKWPDTPEFEAWTKLPFSLLIVAAVIDPEVKQLAEEQKITVAQYSPPWLSASDLAAQTNTQTVSGSPSNA